MLISNFFQIIFLNIYLFKKIYSNFLLRSFFLSTFVLKLYFHFVVQKNRRTFLNYLLYISLITSIVFLVFKLMNHNFDGFAGIGSPSICVVWTNGSQLAGQKVMIGSGLKWTAQKPIYGRP